MGRAVEIEKTEVGAGGDVGEARVDTLIVGCHSNVQGWVENKHSFTMKHAMAILLIVFHAHPKKNTKKAQFVQQLVDIATKEPRKINKVVLSPLPTFENAAPAELLANPTAVTLMVPISVTTILTAAISAASMAPSAVTHWQGDPIHACFIISARIQ